MDRFEAEIKKLVEDNRHLLHSSMDRFEGDEFKLGDEVFILYIPVWIDLKVINSVTLSTENFLYIPVWIDLKFNISRNSRLYAEFTFQYG